MVFLLRLIRKNLFLITYLLLFIFSTWQVGRFNIYQQSYFFNSSNAMAANIAGTKRSITDYFNLKYANQALLAENAGLKSVFYGLNEKDSAVKFQFNDSSIRKRYDFIPAHVIQASTLQQNNFIAIDKGLDDGITKDMAVIAPNGIVGVVLDVSSGYSFILPVLNTKFKATPMIPAIGFRDGSITWDGANPRKIQLNGVSRFEKIQAGMEVVTSNYSVKFPPGIPIGRVYSVKNTGKSSFFDIQIEPSVDYSRLSHVYVVRNRNKAELDTLIKRNDGR